MHAQRLATLAALTTLAAAPSALASSGDPQRFFGQDVQTLEDFGGDQHALDNTRMTSTPNSDMARAAFIAKLTSIPLISIGEEDFEDATPGTIMDDDFFITPGVGTMTVSDGEIFRIEDPNATNGEGRYPRSGEQYLLLEPQNPAEDQVTLTFSQPQVAIGFDGVDIGDFGGELTAVIARQADGTVTELVLPFHDGSGVVGQDGSISGSVLFWGIIDVKNPFVSLTLVRCKECMSIDGFAFDDLILGSIIPTPMAAGLGLLGLTGLATRRRRPM
jgi:hypothetical protein